MDSVVKKSPLRLESPLARPSFSASAAMVAGVLSVEPVRPIVAMAITVGPEPVTASALPA